MSKKSSNFAAEMEKEAKTSYLTIEAKAEGLYKDKGSRFLAFAEPVCTEDDIRERLACYRKEYHDARHVCFAYKLGEISRSSDDGEPSGTAGRPIMGRIESAGLDRILIVVVRYFGGILLGTGGLVVAYREATADVLAHARIIEKEITVEHTLRFSAERLHEVMALVKETDARIVNQNWDGAECEMTLEVPLSNKEKFNNI